MFLKREVVNRERGTQGDQEAKSQCRREAGVFQHKPCAGFQIKSVRCRAGRRSGGLCMGKTRMVRLLNVSEHLGESSMDTAKHVEKTGIHP